MLVGTGSDVGKSVLCTALCRMFLQDGYHPAPFKAQNMALNSYATPDGLEIGRAQAVQAEAAKVPCHTDMNPLLLKPNSEHTTQVVLNGKPIGNRSAYEYFRKEGREELRQEVHAAFDRLAAKYNPEVIVLFPGLDDTLDIAIYRLQSVGYMGNIITVNTLDQIIELVAEYSHEEAILIGGNGQDTIIEIQERIKLISENL